MRSLDVKILSLNESGKPFPIILLHVFPLRGRVVSVEGALAGNKGHRAVPPSGVAQFSSFQ